MPTKTISLELDAYEHLRRAKRSKRESFSEVVRRATFPDTTLNSSELLAYFERRGPLLNEAATDNLETVHEFLSRPPEDTWEATP